MSLALHFREATSLGMAMREPVCKLGSPLPRTDLLLALCKPLVLGLLFLLGCTAPDTVPQPATLPTPTPGAIASPVRVEPSPHSPVTATPTATTVETMPSAPAPTRAIPATATPALPEHVRQPRIDSFTTDRDLVSLGESVTLAWKSDAVSAQLCNPYQLLGTVCLPVATSGNMVVSLAHARRSNDVQEFSLIVGSGPDITGKIESRELSIAVKCPTAWFFASAPDECARPAARSAAIAQRFEHGSMIELRDEKRIFILFEDSSQGSPYNEIQDTWQPAVAETDPNLSPPAGMYQPRRGLGIAWRELNRESREKLGWASQPEFVYDAVFQCNAGLGDVYARCYLLDPGNRVIVLGRGKFYQWSVLTP